MRQKRKVKTIVFAVIAIVIVFIAIVVSNVVSTLKKGEKELAAITFTDIDVSRIKDGTYTGECKAGLVSVKVKTTVNHGKIADIKLTEHQNGKGSTAESIIDEMILKQTTKVDAVSGATYSSKVIRKAVENSLIKGE